MKFVKYWIRISLDHCMYPEFNQGFSEVVSKTVYQILILMAGIVNY